MVSNWAPMDSRSLVASQNKSSSVSIFRNSTTVDRTIVFHSSTGNPFRKSRAMANTRACRASSGLIPLSQPRLAGTIGDEVSVTPMQTMPGKGLFPGASK